LLDCACTLIILQNSYKDCSYRCRGQPCFNSFRTLLTKPLSKSIRGIAHACICIKEAPYSSHNNFIHLYLLDHMPSFHLDMIFSENRYFSGKQSTHVIFSYSPDTTRDGLVITSAPSALYIVIKTNCIWAPSKTIYALWCSKVLKYITV